MPEQSPKIETQEKMEFLPYFSTDLERAKDGLAKFNEVFKKSEVLRKATENGGNRKILLSIMGLFPEMGFYGGTGFDRMKTEQERKELQKIYEEEFGLKLLFWNEPAEGKQWQCSIINPASVEKVIKNCPIPDLFPEEARRDSVKWVLSNKFEWDDPDSDGDFNDEEIRKRAARFGILSGYAPRASAAYPDFKLAEKTIVNKLGEKEQKFYSKYVRSEKDGRKLSGPLEGLLASSVEKGVISSFQAKLLRNNIVHKDMAGFGYGFFDEDEKYFDNIRIIFDKLGIKSNT